MMERKQLSIIVTGGAGSGKSRIIYLIKEMLKQEGFDVEFEDRDYLNESRFNEAMLNNLDVVLDKLKGQCDITIKTRQINKQTKHQSI